MNLKFIIKKQRKKIPFDVRLRVSRNKNKFLDDKCNVFQKTIESNDKEMSRLKMLVAPIKEDLKE